MSSPSRATVIPQRGKRGPALDAGPALSANTLTGVAATIAAGEAQHPSAFTDLIGGNPARPACLTSLTAAQAAKALSGLIA